MTTSSVRTTHDYRDLITLFAQCFEQDYNTRLVKGDDEPIYLPADEQFSYHRIVFAHGFYASAFHEISHWCIAGGYLRGHLTLAVAEAEEQGDTSVQALYQRVCDSVQQAIKNGELSPPDQILVNGMWDDLFQRASQIN